MPTGAEHVPTRTATPLPLPAQCPSASRFAPFNRHSPSAHARRGFFGAALADAHCTAPPLQWRQLTSTTPAPSVSMYPAAAGASPQRPEPILSHRRHTQQPPPPRPGRRLPIEAGLFCASRRKPLRRQRTSRGMAPLAALARTEPRRGMALRLPPRIAAALPPRAACGAVRAQDHLLPRLPTAATTNGRMST